MLPNTSCLQLCDVTLGRLDNHVVGVFWQKAKPTPKQKTASFLDALKDDKNYTNYMSTFESFLKDPKDLESVQALLDGLRGILNRGRFNPHTPNDNRMTMLTPVFKILMKILAEEKVNRSNLDYNIQQALGAFCTLDKDANITNGDGFYELASALKTAAQNWGLRGTYLPLCK